MSIQTKARQLPCEGCGSDAPKELADSPWWLPGIVVVEFKRPVSPKRVFEGKDAASQKDLSWIDIGKLRRTVDRLLIRPPEWTFSFEREKPPSEKDYERFITLHLQPDVNVPAIAKELSKVAGVVRAAGEPRLAPPIQQIPFNEPMEAPVGTVAAATEVPLLNEPLALSGGDPLGKSIHIGTLRNQWYLFRSQADVVLKSGITGAGVVVADIDWGFKVDHQEFVNNRIKFKFNASNGSDNVSSGLMRWHGTGTLGLIGAGDSDTGMLGFASGADLWAIQGPDQDGTVDNADWAKAIETARLTPSGGKRKVILVEVSTDLGFNVEASMTLREPIIQAIADNCVVCVTAGNAGEDAGIAQNKEPIPESGSILVGATQYNDDPTEILRSDSNWGSRVVVSAPGATGTDVTCCDCGIDKYRTSFGGTSGAAAKVAGAMALVLEAHPDITHYQIVDVLKTRMPQIATSDKPMGCFLDVRDLMTQIDLYLSEQ